MFIVSDQTVLAVHRNIVFVEMIRNKKLINRFELFVGKITFVKARFFEDNSKYFFYNLGSKKFLKFFVRL